MPGWVLCEKVDEEKVTKGGIALPDNLGENEGLKTDKLERGKVLGAGAVMIYGNPWVPGETRHEAIRLDFAFAPGDVIYYSTTAGYHHSDNEGRKLRVVEYREVRGVATA
jgi:co-chaperonin GroES (HSP10)